MEVPKLKTRAGFPSPASTNEKMSKSSAKLPTPLDLDHFVPWMFTELQASQTVVVRRLYREEYTRKNSGRKSISRPYLVSKNVPSQVHVSHRVDLHATAKTKAPTTDTDTLTEENTIQLTTFYNRTNELVEIAINDCPFPINRKLIDTISLCLPFHNFLNKVTIKGKGLDCNVIDEIAKMLPLSHLTEICLDGTFVPQGNYYVLLEQATTLKCLSLSKCRINDVVCKKLAECLEFSCPASKNLLILCLSSNFITDIGAQALGKALRTNRHMLHLNLCGNSITSVGAGHLLEPLSEFLLTADEVKEKIRRRWDYYKRKAAVALAAVSKDETTNETTDLNMATDDNHKIRESLKKISQFDFTYTVVNATGVDEKTVEDYVFGLSNTVHKNGCWYTAGNMVLCSLNLGFNNLDYTSLPKFIEVLLYQKEQVRCTGCTGLLRIVIEGNNLPVHCEEYSKINTYLDIMRNEALSFKKKRGSSTSRKVRHSTIQLRSPRDSNANIANGGRNSPPRGLSPLSAR